MTDREKLIELIIDIENKLISAYPYTTDEYRIKETVDHLIANGVMVQKHGRWIPFLDGDSIMPERYYRCSRCGRIERRREPYCNCGAKMDLKE